MIGAFIGHGIGLPFLADAEDEEGPSGGLYFGVSEEHRRTRRRKLDKAVREAAKPKEKAPERKKKPRETRSVPAPLLQIAVIVAEVVPLFDAATLQARVLLDVERQLALEVDRALLERRRRDEEAVLLLTI